MAYRAWWHRPIILALETWRVENQKFKVTLGYIVNLRPAWAT